MFHLPFLVQISLINSVYHGKCFIVPRSERLIFTPFNTYLIASLFNFLSSFPLLINAYRKIGNGFEITKNHSFSLFPFSQVSQLSPQVIYSFISLVVPHMNLKLIINLKPAY